MSLKPSRCYTTSLAPEILRVENASGESTQRAPDYQEFISLENEVEVNQFCDSVFAEPVTQHLKLQN
jgi:hypothetical protein